MWTISLFRFLDLLSHHFATTYICVQNMWIKAIQIFYAMSFDCVLPYEYTWFETLMNMFSLVLKCAAGSSMFVCVYKRLLTHSLFSAHFLSCLNFFCHCWLLFFYSYLVYNHKNSTYLHIWRVNKAFELINMHFGISIIRKRIVRWVLLKL